MPPPVQAAMPRGPAPQPTSIPQQPRPMMPAQQAAAGAPVAAEHTQQSGPQPSAAYIARLNRVAGNKDFSRWDSGAAQQAGASVAPPPETPAPQGRESRRSKRKSTRLAGLIHLTQGRSDIECSVRDISATGALISLAPVGGGRRNVFDKKAEVPDRFWMTLKADRMKVECQVMRRDGEEIGVQFLSAPRMA